MSLFTTDVDAIIYEPPAPKYLYVEIVEFEAFLALRIFQDNFYDISQPQRDSAVEWVSQAITRIRKLGVPCYLEVYDRPDGKRIEEL